MRWSEPLWAAEVFRHRRLLSLGAVAELGLVRPLHPFVITEPPIQQTTATAPATPGGKRISSLWVAGILVPCLCLLFDPVVFQLGGFAVGAFREPLLWEWQPFAYAAILLAGALAAIYLLRPKLPDPLLSVMGGAFAAASLLALGLGCYLLPTSFLCLALLIGVLGFSPFLTSLAYFRAARRIWRQVVLVRSRRTAVIGLFAGVVIYCATAYSIHVRVEHAFREAVASAAEGRPASLIVFRVFGDHRLLHAYQTETSEVRQQHLADAYRQLTGNNIDTRLYDLND
jgi:hypothetical protein